MGIIILNSPNSPFVRSYTGNISNHAQPLNIRQLKKPLLYVNKKITITGQVEISDLTVVTFFNAVLQAFII